MFGDTDAIALFLMQISLMTPEVILKKYYGYNSFRDKQEAIIQHVLNKQDAVVVMPTGGGKSVCFQIPAMLLPGIAIVVSPLIALMKDQVDGLNAIGIPAIALNSSMNAAEQQEAYKRINKGEIKLLYVAPERIMSEGGRFIEFLKTLPISLFAIDEAHCVSMWGHDFRPEYLQLAVFKQQFPGIPVIALTASADAITRKDIAEKLLIAKSKIFISSFNRANINYIIERKKDALDAIIEYIEAHKNQSGIIYTLSRNGAETLAGQLSDAGFAAKYYHAGLDNVSRAKVQEEFKTDRINIIVATIAFGMGIDKPDVRFVIHYNMPKNIESYYQETGRAGRDGLKSDAILFYSYGDVMALKRFVEVEDKTQAAIMYKKLDQMAGFCDARKCRRKMILEYFGETYSVDNCQSCDYCLSKRNSFEATVIAQKALSAVVRTEERFGVNYLIDFLRGSKSEKIWDKHKLYKTYGIGADISKEKWTLYFRELIDQGFLHRDESGDYPRLTLTEKSQLVLQGRQEVYFSIVEEKVRAKAIPEIEFDLALYEQLRSFRTKIAYNENLPPYMVIGDATLQSMAAYLPQSLNDLPFIPGFGEIKIERYGKKLLDIVISHCRINKLTSRMELLNKRAAKKSSGSKPAKIAETKKTTLYMFRSGKSIAEIAAERNFAPSTIEGHLCEFILTGDVSVNQFVSPEKIEMITRYIKHSTDKKITPIKEKLGDDYSFFEIRAVLSHLDYLAN